jgi:hypothetical protein
MNIRRSLTCAVMAFSTLVGTAAYAQNFQLVVTVTPPVGGSGQDILRFNIAGTNGAATPLSPILAAQTNDPAGLVFRTPNDLFVGNRHGNNGSGSIRKFSFDASFNPSAGSITTGNGLRNVHQLAMDRANDQLYAVDVFTSRLSRFSFDGSGELVADTFFSLASDTRGVAVSADGSQIFTSIPNSNRILRYQRIGGGLTQLADIVLPNGLNPHYMQFRGNELFVADLGGNVGQGGNGRIHRVNFDANGNPWFKPLITGSNSPLDLTFSPDGMEMFASNHLSPTGIDRYLYNAGSDTWTLSGNIATGASLGGVATTFGAVPEPGTMAALGLGIAALLKRRRKS